MFGYLSRVVFFFINSDDLAQRIGENLRASDRGARVVPIVVERLHNLINLLIGEVGISNLGAVLTHLLPVPELPASNVLLFFKFHKKAMSDGNTQVEVKSRDGIDSCVDVSKSVHSFI